MEEGTQEFALPKGAARLSTDGVWTRINMKKSLFDVQLKGRNLSQKRIAFAVIAVIEIIGTPSISEELLVKEDCIIVTKGPGDGEKRTTVVTDDTHLSVLITNKCPNTSIKVNVVKGKWSDTWDIKGGAKPFLQGCNKIQDKCEKIEVFIVGADKSGARVGSDGGPQRKDDNSQLPSNFLLNECKGGFTKCNAVCSGYYDQNDTNNIAGCEESCSGYLVSCNNRIIAPSDVDRGAYDYFRNHLKPVRAR
jgi:hypothetical protein